MDSICQKYTLISDIPQWIQRCARMRLIDVSATRDIHLFNEFLRIGYAFMKLLFNERTKSASETR